MMRWAAAVVGMLTIASFGLAAATGTLLVGPAGLYLDNGKTTSCMEDVSGLCLATLHQGTPGDTVVDGDQTFDRVEVWIDRTQINDAIGFDLLPDGAVRFAPSMHEVPYPPPRLLAEHVGTKRPAELGGNWGVTFREDGMGLWYFGPDLNPIDPTPHPDGFWWPYGTTNDEADATLDSDNDSINLGEDYGNISNDDIADDIEDDSVCAFLGSPGCVIVLHPYITAVRQTTPNIIIGAELTQARAGLENESPNLASNGGAKEGGIPLGPRAWVETPASLRPRDMLSPSGPGAIPDPGSRPIPPSSRDGPAPYSVVPHGPKPIPSTPPDASLGLRHVAAFAIAVALAALFSRMRKEDMLADPHRRAILSELAAGPQRLSALAPKLGIDRTTIAYHASQLARVGLVLLERRGRSTFVLLPGQEAPARGMVTGEVGGAVREVLSARGGRILRVELHAALREIPQRSRNHAIRQLVETGVLCQIDSPSGVLLALRP